MKEHPILFSGPMVRAILDGRKTQTRRVVKPQPDLSGFETYRPIDGRRYTEQNAAEARCSSDGWYFGIPGMSTGPWRRPYGQPGDRLWVRETFNWSSDELLLPKENHRRCPERAAYAAKNVVWRADGERRHPEHGEAIWKPSIHMPRWASRITLEITNVRVERLQEISEQDAETEGVGCDEERRIEGGAGPLYYPCTACSGNPRGIAELCHPTARGKPWRCEFAQLWDALNSMRGFGWSTNPWVWCISFQKL